MIYGLESVALTNRQEAEMDVGDMKILRFSLGVTRMDGIRNEFIRGTAQVREVRLGWFGHVQRWDSGYTGKGC